MQVARVPRGLLLLLTIVISALSSASGQPVFDARDTLLRWDASQPYGSPRNPRTVTSGLQKWVSVETPGISQGSNAFDVSSFKAYFLRLNGKSVAFRLKFPHSYGNPDSAGKKYPLMLFFHGAGEPACVTNGGIYNNEKHLIYGAEYFRNQVDENNFDGFLLYPQIYTTNTGCYATSWNKEHYFPLLMNVLDSMVRYARLDIDRVLLTGLSSGGIAAWRFAEAYPDRVAALAPSSAIGGTGTLYSRFIHLPIWLGTGALDNNPSLSTATTAVTAFTNLGGAIRHTLYPDQGHFIWNMHWQEPGFVDFMNAAHKANPLVYFQHTAFCPDSAISARLGISPGFYAYEWEWNGSLIATSTDGMVTISNPSVVTAFTGNELTVNQLGEYRVRFRRTDTSSWSAWSPKPAVLKARESTAGPVIEVKGLYSSFLPAPNGQNTVPLSIPSGFTNYQWVSLPDSNLVAATSTFEAPPGTYRARYTVPFGCGSPYSAAFTVHQVSAETAPSLPDSFMARPTAYGQVRLSWQPPQGPSQPVRYELYRTQLPGGPPVLLTILPGMLHQYTDTAITPGSVYSYQLRALSDSNASLLFPAVRVRAATDRQAPAVPQNLQWAGGDNNSVAIRWRAATDNDRVDHYSIRVDGQANFATSDTFFRIARIDPFQLHRFAVQAIDASGNRSAWTSECLGQTITQGLHFRYYRGNWDNLPDFNTLQPTASGVTTAPTLTNPLRNQSDNFGFVWEGFLWVPVSGQYEFELKSDDGSRLWLDHHYDYTFPSLINNDGLHALQTQSASLYLKKGFHRFAAAFFEKAGSEQFEISWKRPGETTVEPIPDTYFSLDSIAIPADPETLPIPVSPEYKGSTDSSISIAWNGSDEIPSPLQYYIYLNNQLLDSATQTEYRLTGLDSGNWYRISIAVMDSGRRLSGPSPALRAFTHRAGLNYAYYEGSWSALPNFSSITAVATGITDSIHLACAGCSRTDQFAMEWRGFLYIPQPGNYTFELSSDDGSRLYIDSLPESGASSLITNDGLHAVITQKNSRYYEAGYHSIALQYFEQQGDELIELVWTTASGLRQKIPATFFCPEPVPEEPHPAEQLHAPVKVEIMAIDPQLALLSWELNPAADSIRIKCSRGGEFYHTCAILDGGVTTWTDSLTCKGWYYYTVEAVGKDSIAGSDTVGIYHGNSAPQVAIAANTYLKEGINAYLNFSFSDPDGDTLMLELSGGEGFAFLEPMTANKARIRFEPTAQQLGIQLLRLLVRDSKGGSVEKQVSVTVSYRYTRSVYIRFGHSSIPAPKPWNNFSGAIAANAVKTALRDEKNQVTPFSITMLDAWSSLTGLCFTTGTNSGIYPDTVIARGIRDPSASRRIRIAGLDPNLRYNLAFTAGVNEGTYAANAYSCNGQKDTLVIRYNAHETGNLNGLTPNASGELLIAVNRLPGTPYIYLSGIVLEEYQPATPLLAPASLYAENTVQMGQVQLYWQDRSDREAAQGGFVLTRAESADFTRHPVHFPLPANQTRFLDSGLAAGRNYYYRIRAVAATDSSAYSNWVEVETPGTIALLNFNHNTAAAPAPWNNSASGPNYTNRFPPLLDIHGINTGIAYRIESTFNGENNAGMNTGNNSGMTPDETLRGNYWLDKLQVGRIRLTGLRTDRKYTVGFFGSIGPNGWTANNYTATYRIGNRMVYLNSWQNTSKIVYIDQLVPDPSGELLLEFSSTRDAAFSFHAGIVLMELGCSPAGLAVPEAKAGMPLLNTKPLSAADNPGPLRVKAFPVPFSNSLQLAFENSSASNRIGVQLFNLQGKQVYQSSHRLAQGWQRLQLTPTLAPSATPQVLLLVLTVNGRRIFSQKITYLGGL